MHGQRNVIDFIYLTGATSSSGIDVKKLGNNWFTYEVYWDGSRVCCKVTNNSTNGDIVCLIQSCFSFKITEA